MTSKTDNILLKYIWYIKTVLINHRDRGATALTPKQKKRGRVRCAWLGIVFACATKTLFPEMYTLYQGNLRQSS